ncbi:chemotaxis protein [Ferrimonas balearica]|uniref:chemotaxis protein n=1 Tax=Ferrimonas balearica TaxID=44012 RepID=UPI001C99BD38|nr:chemotaxis protein CheV [Ferrimonas balearica]MBY5994110.1 chemotaxis protein CheV [Ferrimonas balearica]
MNQKHSSRQEYLVFSLAHNQMYAFSTLKVQEIVSVSQFSQLPGSHPAVAGTLTLRGETLAVVDLNRAIGLQGEPPQSVVVCEIQGTRYGLLVGTIEAIQVCDSGDITAIPARLARQALSTGVFRDGQDRLVQLLDLERIIGELNPGAGTAMPELDAASLARIRAQKILICDDSRFARRQMARVLEQHGIDYLSAPNGKAALSILKREAERQEPVQILVSDIEMPELDGYQLALSVRANQDLDPAYVILHSSLNPAICERISQQAGADEGLTKFDPHALLEAIGRGAGA